MGVKTISDAERHFILPFTDSTDIILSNKMFTKGQNNCINIGAGFVIQW